MRGRPSSMRSRRRRRRRQGQGRRAGEGAREKQKEKRTKTITATGGAHKRQREKDAYAGEDPSSTSARVFQQRAGEVGREVTEGRALDIIDFLQQLPDYAEAGLDEIRRAVGIDLNANASLLTTLCNNKKIETDGPEQSLRLRYRPAYGVRDASSLLHLLSYAYPGAADGHTEAVMRSELTKFHETEAPGARYPRADARRASPRRPRALQARARRR